MANLMDRVEGRYWVLNITFRVPKNHLSRPKIIFGVQKTTFKVEWTTFGVQNSIFGSKIPLLDQNTTFEVLKTLWVLKTTLVGQIDHI